MTPAEAKDALPRCGMRIYIGRSSEANLTERMAGAVALGLTNRWVDTNGIDDTEIGVSVKRCFYMDPDIIGISRLSSAQAAKAAVMAMECGHLVLTTLDVETEEDAKAKLRNWGLGENLWSTPGFIHFCLR